MDQTNEAAYLCAFNTGIFVKKVVIINRFSFVTPLKKEKWINVVF